MRTRTQVFGMTASPAGRSTQKLMSMSTSKMVMELLLATRKLQETLNARLVTVSNPKEVCTAHE